jgi:hypothetical protein
MAIHEQAEGIAWHVRYAFQRMLEDARDLQNRAGGIVSPCPRLAETPSENEPANRAVESFLLHARNVYDFFFTAPRPNMPDVSVQQFFDIGQTWKPDANHYCPYLTRERNRLHRSIQHLSYDRIAFERNKQWEVATIVSELTAVWNEYLRRLSVERRGWFSSSEQPATPLENLCANTQPSVPYESDEVRTHTAGDVPQG